MNEQEKSLKLAELMGWDSLRQDKEAWLDGWLLIKSDDNVSGYCYPYGNEKDDLAQFAAILLRFPEVMCEFVYRDQIFEDNHLIGEDECTQANILNAILEIHGIDPDA